MLTSCSVWQQNRNNNTFRNTNSRTPQNNRSNAASPQPPKAESSHPPPRNVWATKPTASNGPAFGAQNQSQSNAPVNNNSSFSIEDAKAVLYRKTTAAPYKPSGTAASSKATAGAGVAKMANGQPFFAHLAKQVASLEAGG